MVCLCFFTYVCVFFNLNKMIRNSSVLFLTPPQKGHLNILLQNVSPESNTVCITMYSHGLMEKVL